MRRWRSSRKKIVVIGGGASGTLTAVHGAREWKNTDIYLAERSGLFGPGYAYGVDEPSFVLNVPAGKMGGLADDPGHFYQWLIDEEKRWRSLHPDFSSVIFEKTDFVPRMIYGAYLKWLLEKSHQDAKEHGNKLFLIRDEVISVSPLKNKNYPLRVSFSAQKPLKADSVVFATGNSFGKTPRATSDHVFNSPYEDAFLHREWKSSDRLLILGAGLSMVDAAWYLSRKNFPGEIMSFSRSGLKPFPHTDKQHNLSPPFTIDDRPSTPSAMVSSVRKQIKSAAKEGIAWQAIIDSFRPVSNSIWLSLTPYQQKRLWKVLSWWNPARHRIPAFAEKALQTMRDDGKLFLEKGNVRAVRETPSGVEAQLADGSVIKGTAALHCLGFDYRADNLQALCPDIPLLRHWSGNAGAIGKQHYRLSEQYPVYGIGPVLFGHYIESTAVPDIRLQTSLLCRLLPSDNI